MYIRSRTYTHTLDMSTPHAYAINLSHQPTYNHTQSRLHILFHTLTHTRTHTTRTNTHAHTYTEFIQGAGSTN